jgi:hypothetical protein
MKPNENYNFDLMLVYLIGYYVVPFMKRCPPPPPQAALLVLLLHLSLYTAENKGELARVAWPYTDTKHFFIQ